MSHGSLLKSRLQRFSVLPSRSFMDFSSVQSLSHVQRKALAAPGIKLPTSNLPLLKREDLRGCQATSTITDFRRLAHWPTWVQVPTHQCLLLGQPLCQAYYQHHRFQSSENMKSEDCCPSPFSDEETEVQGGKVTHPRPHGDRCPFRIWICTCRARKFMSFWSHSRQSYSPLYSQGSLAHETLKKFTVLLS